MPQAAIIGGAVVAGAAISYIGAEKQAKAMQGAAEAQLLEAQKTRGLATEAAKPSVDELMMQHQLIENNFAAINRQNKLLDAVDPALIEAGHQALNLLKGEEARSIAPLRKEIDRQREMFAQRLTSQMGSGALQTTAGQNAMAEFDRNASNTISQTQMATLGQLLGSAQASRPNPYSAVDSSGATLGALGRPRERMVAAITNTPITPYAGAPFVGAAIEGANISQIGRSISSMAGSAAGSQMGATAPTSSPESASQLGQMQKVKPESIYQ